MCLLCLQGFEFDLPGQEQKQNLEKKKKRLARIKVLLKAADSLMAINYSICQETITALKEEQYRLSREF